MYSQTYQDAIQGTQKMWSHKIGGLLTQANYFGNMHFFLLWEGGGGGGGGGGHI